MKKHTFITLAAVMFCVGVGLPAQAQETDELKTTGVVDAAGEAGDAAGESDGEVAEEKDSVTKLTESVTKLRAGVEEVVKAYGALKVSSQTKVNRFERSKSSAEGALQNVEKAIESIRAIEDEHEKLIQKSFDPTRITREQGEAFLVEADEALTEAMRLMKSKSDEVKIKGLEMFEEATKKYQGAVSFPEALKKFNSTIGKFNAKWARAKESLQKTRSKSTESALKRAEAQEKIQFDKLEQRMTAADKNVNRDWFIPLATNLLMLERACARVKSAESTMEREVKQESVGCLPEVMEKFWEAFNRAINTMLKGDFDAAEEQIRDADVLHEISRLSEFCMPQDMRRSFTEQAHDLSAEIRNRRNELRRIEQRKSREEMNAERSLSAVSSAIERMRVDVEEIQEAEKRAEEDRRRHEEEKRASIERRAAAEGKVEGDDEEEEDKASAGSSKEK